MTKSRSFAGKNDGSVAGIRYFQCPRNRGVFSRLQRLKRAPVLAVTNDDSGSSHAYAERATYSTPANASTAGRPSTSVSSSCSVNVSRRSSRCGSPVSPLRSNCWPRRIADIRFFVSTLMRRHDHIFLL